MQGQRPQSVMAEPDRIPLQHFQFIEIEEIEVQAVDKTVIDCVRPGMTQLTGIEP